MIDFLLVRTSLNETENVLHLISDSKLQVTPFRVLTLILEGAFLSFLHIFGLDVISQFVI